MLTQSHPSRAPRSPDRGALYALAGLVAATIIAFFVWLPFVLPAVVLGWVAGVVLVWLYAQGAGAPRGRLAQAAVIVGVLVTAPVIAFAGEIGYLLRAIAGELDLEIVDLLLTPDNLRYFVIPTLFEPRSWTLPLAGGVFFGLAATLGLFQSLGYTKRRDARARDASAHDAKSAATAARARALVEAVVAELPPNERAALSAQAATVHAVTRDGSVFGVEVDRATPPSTDSQNPLAVSAEIVDGEDAVPAGVILVWLDDLGYLARLEFVSSTGHHIETLPPVSRIMLRHAHSW